MDMPNTPLCLYLALPPLCPIAVIYNMLWNLLLLETIYYLCPPHTHAHTPHISLDVSCIVMAPALFGTLPCPTLPCPLCVPLYPQDLTHLCGLGCLALNE